jgi:hypothetical protein
MMGYGYDPFLSERSLKPPVFHTSTFVFRSAQDGKEFFELAYGLRQKRPNEAAPPLAHIGAGGPSAKYSCSGSPLILANGSTAIDGLSGSSSDGSTGADAASGVPANSPPPMSNGNRIEKTLRR